MTGLLPLDFKSIPEIECLMKKTVRLSVHASQASCKRATIAPDTNMTDNCGAFHLVKAE